MKFITRLFLFVVLATLGSCYAAKEYHLSFATPEQLREFLTWRPNRVPVMSAHRGGPEAGFPENSIAAFENTIKHAPAIIEFDVALTKDSVLVIMHDDKIDRTTTGAGPIGNYTYAELRQFHLKDKEGRITPYTIPTLDEVLTWAADKVILCIDLKKGVPYSKIVEAVQKHKAERYSIVITYTANQAAEVHRLDSTLMISASIQSRQDLERLNNLGVKNANLAAFTGVREPDKTLYEYLHKKGIMCIVGTMGNLDRSAAARGDQVYYDLLERGADILSTDRSKQAGKQFLQYMRDNNLQSVHLKDTP